MRLKNHYWFLRHGLTTWNHPGMIYPRDNRTSVGLSSEGRKQVEAAAHRLEKEKINLIFASDYRRTRETAEIVSRTLRIKPVFDPRLRDTRMGGYYGRPKTDYWKDFPLSVGFRKGPRNGDSWNDVQHRIKEFLQDTEKKYRGQNILIVSHGDPLWLLEGVMRGQKQRELLGIIAGRQDYIKKGELRRLN